MCEALDDHEGSVSIGGRLITNFRFADDYCCKCKRGRRSWRPGRPSRYNFHKVQKEIGLDKMKVMTNNPNGFLRQIKINCQRLEAVENFKYLGAIISNKGSKSEILSRIAQTTTSFSRLKIIWRDKNISLASKVKLMRTLIVSTFLLCLWELDLDSRTQEKDPSPWDEMLYETSEHFLQRPCDERGCSQQKPVCNWSTWWSPNHGEETKPQMVWPYLETHWHGEDNSAGDHERSRKERKTKEEMGR